MSYFHHLSLVPEDHLWLVCVAATQEVPWGTFPMPKMLLSKQNYCGDHHYQAKAVLTFDGFLNSGYTFESSNNCLNTTIWKTPSKEKHLWKDLDYVTENTRLEKIGRLSGQGLELGQIRQSPWKNLTEKPLLTSGPKMHLIAYAWNEHKCPNLHSFRLHFYGFDGLRCWSTLGFLL